MGMVQERDWCSGVPAPVDADGNVVPLTTTVMYDEGGNALKVVGHNSFSFHSGDGQWGVNFGIYGGGLVSRFHLVPPDSLERLADDLARYDENKVMCEYFGMTVDGTCDGCRAHSFRAHHPGSSCIWFALSDIARRARALREAERDAD